MSTERLRPTLHLRGGSPKYTRRGFEKSLPLNAALTPSNDELRRATAIVDGFEAARARGEDRALIDGLWVEVATYRNAKRLIERARRLKEAVIELGTSHNDA